ncbi:MAG: hybrid sensor histidine kinase/response regulator [Bacteroidia bacterium]
MTILLIEDNVADARLIEEYLRKQDFGELQFFHAQEMKTGAQIYKDMEIEIVLLDLSLPDSFGDQTYKVALHQFSDTPLVILSGLDDRETAVKAIKEGAQDFLVKGEFNSTLMIKTIRYAIERHRMKQDMLRTLDELKLANLNLEQFAYVASHDLKSPANNLMSLLKMWDEDFTDLDHNKKIFSMISASVKQLKKTLDALIDVITIQKSIGQRKTEVQVKKVFEEVQDSINELILESGARIQTDFSKAPAVNYSLPHFKSIMQNLISNAIKYRHPDRQVKIDISTAPEGSYIVLKVQDNGLGMDIEANKGRLFGLFTRLHDHVEGSGVGLYTVNSIVESYGGKIEVDSKVGEGTRFKIYMTK